MSDNVAKIFEKIYSECRDFHDSFNKGGIFIEGRNVMK